MKRVTACVLLFYADLGFLVAQQHGFAADKNFQVAQVGAPAKFSSLRQDISARVMKGEFPSFAVGVIQCGSVIWAETFGWADREQHVAATPTTAYGLASLGKSITATAVMTLVEQGKASLDQPANKLIQPDHLTIYEGSADGPTLRQLLNMTSGIPHGALTYTTPEIATGITDEQVLKNRALVVFPPGKVFHYSNFSIAAAQRAIERISGLPFGEYLSHVIFQALGMQQSFLAPDNARESTQAVRYDDDGKRVDFICPFPRSSRGIWASLDDLLAYAFFNLKCPQRGHTSILNVASIDALHNSRATVPGAYMALGWGSIDLRDGSRWVVSDGRDIGVQSVLSIIPSAKVAVICLTNISGNQVDEIALRISDVLVPGFAAQATAAMQTIEAADTVPFKSSDPWFGKWRGTLKTSDGDLPIEMSFKRDGDIKVSMRDQYPTLMSEARFSRGLLSGALLAKLPLEEKPIHYHRLELCLRLDHDRLYGFAFANFTNDRGKFEIPTYVALRHISH
jgi:CubicO group peptidase (beta-lactamase class C family)